MAKPGPSAPNSGITVRITRATAASSRGSMGRIRTFSGMAQRVGENAIMRRTSLCASSVSCRSHAQEILHCPIVHRRGKQVALHMGCVATSKELALLFGFDAFGGDGQAQTFGQPHDRFADGTVGVIV